MLFLITSQMASFQALHCGPTKKTTLLKSSKTRLHSSRMRTARALTVPPSMLCTGGVVPGPGGAWSGGVMPGLGSACSRGYPSMHQGRIPPVNRITHACEKYNLAPTSLRAVITQLALERSRRQLTPLMVLHPRFARFVNSISAHVSLFSQAGETNG